VALRETETGRSQDPGRLSFGPFELSIAERQLLREGVPVPVGSRSLDILIVLARNAGRVIGNRELLSQVWDGLKVEEGALRVHINGLRKALRDGKDGARYILNVPGRGYSLVASVPRAASLHSEAGQTPPARYANIPPMPHRMIGRDDEVQSLVAQLGNLRFISLVGPGGIGKTTVAIKALHAFREEFDGPIYFISLSTVSDPQVVHQTVASMLGVGSGIGHILPDLLSFLQREPCLLVLDSCEHLIEPVAALVEAVRDHAPRALLLTTTREPLRVDGEHLVRLTSLKCPPDGVALTAADCLAYPAAELFVDRVKAGVEGFHLTDDDAPIVASICRKLDGVALALELGAGRVEAYGLAETAQLLGRRLGLLWNGRRTAPPRHQTLHATLDWSYGLLEECERVVFARLAIFAGAFTLRAAEVVAAGDDIDAAEVVDIVASLVAKSLVSSAAGRSPMQYRLLDTTRTYALEKLAGDAHRHVIARSHAEFLASEFEDASGNAIGVADRFMERLSDVRSALRWCFSGSGDRSIGVRLVTTVAGHLLEHALCDECHQWTELALSNLTRSQVGTPIELELQASLGWSAMFSAGKGRAVEGAFRRGLEIAEHYPDPHQQLRILNGLSFVLSRKCDHIGGLKFAEQAARIAEQTADPSVIALAAWALGVSHHLCGHQGEVLKYCESALEPPSKSPYVRRIAHDGDDYRGRALVARARALWLLGRADEAVRAAHFAIDATDEHSHPVSTFVVLIYATTVFIWCSKWLEAENAIRRLRAHAQAQILVYRVIASALEGVLRCRRGATRADLEALRRSLEHLVAEGHMILVPLCRTVLADSLLSAGLPNEANAVIDAALADLGPQVDGPEVLRVKGTIMISLGVIDQGEGFLRRSVELAREQSALAWELRSAISLAQVPGLTRKDDALADLASAYRRFRAGGETDDLLAAKQLLGRRGS